MIQVQSPDGREWAVRVIRVRLPHRPQSRYEPGWTLLDLVLVPLFWVLLPAARMLLAFPIAFVRALGSERRWVEAECRWPTDLVIRWKTSSDRAAQVAEEVAALLARGYSGGLTVEGAQVEFMTEPPGLRDREA
jgi:hypothetical protein